MTDRARIHTDDLLPSFEHRALLYADDDDYLAGTVPFIESGIAAGEDVMVTVPADRLALIDGHLSADARTEVRCVPMEVVGRNPAWLIPAWADFVAPAVRDGRGSRILGEPIWPSRSGDEIDECLRHEQLTNLALADSVGLQLLCAVDATALHPDVVDGIHQYHPAVAAGDGVVDNDRFDPLVPGTLTDPLPPVPSWATAIAFDDRGLWELRARVTVAAGAAGLRGERASDFVVAVSEAVTNTVNHGGGEGELWCWTDGDRFICEVRDKGMILDPLAGRLRPGLDQDGGRGLWLMHQLCDLVQIRATPDGQVVRLHVSL